MSNSVYYKATDEDGNTVLKHSWKIINIFVSRTVDIFILKMKQHKKCCINTEAASNAKASL